jgi:hypothetical protein
MQILFLFTVFAVFWAVLAQAAILILVLFGICTLLGRSCLGLSVDLVAIYCVCGLLGCLLGQQRRSCLHLRYLHSFCCLCLGSNADLVAIYGDGRQNSVRSHNINKIKQIQDNL